LEIWEISHIMAGACKDKFLSMLCSSDQFPNMKPLGASLWEVIVTFPKVGKGGIGRRLWLGGLHTVGSERAFHVLCGCGGR